MKDCIEFVCTANVGRSPVAELIAADYLQKIGAAFEAISSGSLVVMIQEGKLSIDRQIPFLQIALSRGDVYCTADAPKAEAALASRDEAEVSRLYRIAEARFHDEELMNREAALQHFGIHGKVKSHGDQTIVRRESALILPMAASNKTQVEGLYASSDYHPIIELLGVYATGDLSTGVPDAFGKGKAEYFQVVEAIRDFVPKAIDRFLS